MTKPLKKQPRRGRPPVADAERKRRNFTFRSTDAMQRQLQTAAESSGRSVSEEIEHRVGRSFDQEQHARETPAARNVSLADQVLMSAQLIERGTGKTWPEDQETRRQLLDAVEELLEATLRTPKDAIAAALLGQFGRCYARVARGDVLIVDLLRARKGGEEFKQFFEEEDPQ
jgi:hypothetical protein